MFKNIKHYILAAQTRIIICAGLGIFLVTNSFSPAGSWSGRYSGSKGASVEPFQFTIGVVFMIVAWLIYRKWSASLKQ